ncbi:MAG TPA: acyl-CoA dehydrogenase family protein [Myxococcota bacterium]|nr:acyl-CoA dehydrogenase family protein [Myxococcota bacterium]
MDMELTPEQQALRNEAWTFARQEVAPSLSAREGDRKWDPELLLRMGRDGLLGTWFPKDVGGRGLGALETLLMMEAFAEGGADVGLAMAWAAHSLLAAAPILRFGDDLQKKRFLPKMASGEWLFAFPLCELEAGLNPANVGFKAVRNGEEWLLSGSKTCVVNGPVATHALVTAVTDPSTKPAKTTAFMLDLRSPGVRVAPSTSFPVRTCSVGDVDCQEVKVPVHARVGSEHEAHLQVLPFIGNVERTMGTAPWLGIMNDLLTRSLAHVKAGTVMGQPAVESQAIRRRLFEMRLRVEQARTLVYRTAAPFHKGGSPSVVDAAAAKMYVMDTTTEVAREAVAIHGIKLDPAVERAYRLSMVPSILSGGRELLQTIIAATLLRIG